MKKLIAILLSIVTYTALGQSWTNMGSANLQKATVSGYTLYRWDAGVNGRPVWWDTAKVVSLFGNYYTKAQSDARYVDLTTTQTIGGNKTVTNTLIVNGVTSLGGTSFFAVDEANRGLRLYSDITAHGSAFLEAASASHTFGLQFFDDGTDRHVNIGDSPYNTPWLSIRPTGAYGTHIYSSSSPTDPTELVNLGYLQANYAPISGGNYITALTGDGTATGPGSSVFTLATVNSNVGTFNTLTVNGKGLVTAASNTSYESPLTFSTGLTRSTNTITNNLSTGVAGGGTVRGGTGVTDAVTYISTTGNGTSTAAAHIFKGGNNGATTAMTILNNGNVGILTSPTAPLDVNGDVFFRSTFTSQGAVNLGMANFVVAPLGGVNSSVASTLQFGGSTTVHYRISSANATSATLFTNTNYGSFIIGRAAVTTPATGTNAFLSNLVVTALGTVTSGGATISGTSALYVDGMSTAGILNYGAYFNNGATIAMAGPTSGVVTFKTQAAAGTYNFNVPTTSGNQYDVLASGGGGATPQSYMTAPVVLATITGINAKSTGSTALFVVPTGKTLIVTGVYVKCTAASAITVAASADVGVAAGSVYTNANIGVTAATQSYQFPVGGVMTPPTGTQTLNFTINTAATGTSQTLTVVLVGFLI